MQASHYGGFSCGAEALDSRAQQLWDLGLVAPRHVGSSQTRDQTRVPCIDRWFSTPGPKRKSYTMFKKKKIATSLIRVTVEQWYVGLEYKYKNKR